MKQLLTGVCLLAMNVATAGGLEGYDITKTWEKAVVYVPSRFFPTTVWNVQVDKPSPTIVLLHGCGGINEHIRAWADYLKGQGFVVVTGHELEV